MTRLTSKGIYSVKMWNHPCTIIPPKSEIMRRGGYKCRTLEMNLQLGEQQLKTTSYIYRLISKLQNNCKPKIELYHKQGISGEEMYLIVDKCIIHQKGGHLASFLECRSRLTLSTFNTFQLFSAIAKYPFKNKWGQLSPFLLLICSNFRKWSPAFSGRSVICFLSGEALR